MYEINNQAKYDEFIENLADEFGATVDNGAAMDVAHGVLTSFEIRDGEAHVQRSAEVYGAPVMATECKAISPYDVIQFSHSELIAEWNAKDTASMLAAELLARDLVAERRE